ncbi:cupin domain-containing protein [Hydrogenophaga sp. XSHU_21]
MNTQPFDTFRAQALAEGFDEVLERHWDPGTELETHTHPFSVKAVVTAGDLWLTVDGATRHLRAGDTFALDREVPHAERYGEQGATYWVARRNGA